MIGNKQFVISCCAKYQIVGGAKLSVAIWKVMSSYTPSAILGLNELLKHKC